MPPLPDSMRYPMSGWWWLHAFSAVVIFCWGWYYGQNRAQARFAKFLKDKQDQGAQEKAQ